MVAQSDEPGGDETRSFKVLTPGTVISHYTIVEKIGQGGMGVVYKATDTRLDRTVALKFLPPQLLCDSEARERFEHEAKAASALNHPNIATIYEIDEVEGRCFIAMEYLEGGSLKGLLKARDVSLKEVLDLAIQIGQGLSAAHESGVVHRDIKPDNIMLSSRGLPKIMDFGLAKLKGATKVTKTGTTLGTLHYMSPEQASGGEVDSRSDIFSFGVILYEMVTGHLPFRGEYEAAIINSILNETPEPVARYKADVPEGIQRIVERALEKEAGERYQHADDMVAELRHERRLLETGPSKVKPPVAVRRQGRRYLPIVIPAVVAAVAIVLILVLEPFRLEMGPGKEASAQENSLAIMYFENMVDPEDADRAAQMITALLITDLSESQHIRVVSRQRLYDILKLMGKEDLKVIDRTVASEVANRAGVRWILTGTVLRTEPDIVLTADISEAASGEILVTQRVSGREDEDLFAVVDKLSAQIRQDMRLSGRTGKEPDRPVADVTTHSVEAYRLYLAGVDYNNKSYFPEAEKSFLGALELDSTFAMAYYRLAVLSWYQWGGQKGRQLIAKAMEYSDHVSWKERHLIAGTHAIMSEQYTQGIRDLNEIVDRYPDEKEALDWLAVIHYYLHQYHHAIAAVGKVMEIDSLDVEAHSVLPYVYDRMGEYEQSISALNRYISLAPDEPSPYDTQAELYGLHGKIDQAIESYKASLEREPGFYMALLGLGDMYLFSRQYAKAESCYLSLCTRSEKELRSRGRAQLALIPMFQGKLGEALVVLDDGIAADRLEHAEGRHNAMKHLLKAFIYDQRGNFNLAAAELQTCTEQLQNEYIDDPLNRRDFHAYVLAKAGDLAGAEGVCRSLKEQVDERDQLLMFVYWRAQGLVDMAGGRPDEAASYLKRALEGETASEFHVHFFLGSAYLESGRVGEAVEVLEKALSRYDSARSLVPIASVKAHYLLGQAYEKSGWNNKAMEQYEEFLEIWKDADPGIAEIEDARQRLDRLKTGV